MDVSAFGQLAPIKAIDAKRCITMADATSHKKCVPLHPVKNEAEAIIEGVMGIALNGIFIRPVSRKKWDANNLRGYSKIGNERWTVNELKQRHGFGFDIYNGHDDWRGQYHYHGVDRNLVETIGSTKIGYAVDGFEIHYAGRAALSSYVLREGKRPTNAPSGDYDGKYNEDYYYDSDAGFLDQCNGAVVNGQYVYLATINYPYFSRCLWGDIPEEYQKNPEKAGLPLKLVGRN